MITPLFKLTQNEDFVTLIAKWKYVKFSDFDYFIEDNNFRFSLKPYFLNIALSGNLVMESEKNKFSYDIEKQILTCVLEKKEKGEMFENWDWWSKWFKSEKTGTSASKHPKIEEIDNTDINNNIKVDYTVFHINITNTEEWNAYLFDLYSKMNDNTGKGELESGDVLNKPKNYYGFNNGFIDIFDKRGEDCHEICDFNPKTIPQKFRYLAKIEKESQDFDPERYVYDIFLDQANEEDEISDIKFIDILNKSNKEFIKKISLNKVQDTSVMLYNERELQILQDINKTNISVLLSSQLGSPSPFKFYLQILDILFPYLYDLIITDYEHCSESGWTINKWSSVLSCNVDYDRNFYSQSKEISFSIWDELIKHLFVSNYRRVLTYSLYRNIKLCEKIKKELCDVLVLGRTGIVKCLLDIRIVFDESEPRHLLNTLYIDPLLQWVQLYSEDKIFILLGELIRKVEIGKEELKLDLDVCERDLLKDGE